LRHVDQHVDVAFVTCDGGHADGCLEIGGRDAHSEIDAATGVDGTCDVFGPGEITHDDLRTGPAQRVGALIVASDEGPDRNLPLKQNPDDGTADAADLSRRSRNQYRLLYAHRRQPSSVGSHAPCPPRRCDGETSAPRWHGSH